MTVVTLRGPSEPRGLTVNAFTSVSLDPPLVLVSINKAAKSHDLLRDSPFAVNVLAADQEALALHFAGRPQPGLEIEWVEGSFVPRLAGALAYLECRPWAAYEGGDHTLFVGEVADFGYFDGDGLGYFRSRFVTMRQPHVPVSPGTYDPFELPYDAYE